MIHQDLSQIEGCPERGVKVTVYGLNPWNSLLAFGVDAGLGGLFLFGRCFDLSALRKVSFNGSPPYFSVDRSKRQQGPRAVIDRVASRAVTYNLRRLCPL